MNYSKINVSFLGVSAFFNQTFSSLSVCTRFGDNPLFLSVLIDARLSWDRVTGPDPGRTKHTQRDLRGNPTAPFSLGRCLPAPSSACIQIPRIYLWEGTGAHREEQESICRHHHPKTASKPQLCQKPLCWIILFYGILSAASLHVLNRDLILKCLDSSFISGDDHTLL